MTTGDFVDVNRMYEIIEKYEVDYVFHIGAQSLVNIAYTNPVETIRVNVMGTVSVLEAARRSGRIKGIIVASSDKAYGKTTIASREDSPIGGDHPYEVSKSGADLVATMYAKTYGLPVAVARCGNVYGEGDFNFSRILPGIMRSLVCHERLKIRSDGSFIRDYIYVKDVVEGYLRLLKKLPKMKGEAFNFSSNETLSVMKLIEKIEKLLGKKIHFKIVNTQKNEIPYQSLNWNKAKKQLGFKPTYSLAKTIPNIFSWYKGVL